MSIDGSYSWTDIDGDVGRLSDDEIALAAGTGPALAVLEITDTEIGSERAVYVNYKQAFEIVAWLTARLEACG